jgi:TolB-like protein
VNLRSLLHELKRRRVYSVSAAYLVIGWLIIQIATQVLPFFSIPTWVVQLIVLLFVLGFPVAVICAWAFEVTPEGIMRQEDVDRLLRVRKAGRKLTALIVLFAAAAASLTLFRYVRSSQSREEPETHDPTAEMTGKSIAILPFENLSDDKTNAYFVSGMRDEILTSLAQLPDLNVRSRTSADKYKTDLGDAVTLGRELSVAYFIEGSVQKAGDDVLVNVQLIKTQNGEHLWAQSYRRKIHNIFDVQGEVAQNVADALRLKLAPAQENRLHVPPTTNVRAHDLFLRAHALGAHADEKSLQGKIALLEEVVGEDRHYAMAWGDLAGAYLTIADAYRAPREVLTPMRHAALKAVETDEGSGVGHIWLGAVSMLYDRNFPMAKSELERAVILNPNSADAHRWLGWYLARVERNFTAGREELQRARALDPLYTWPLMFECYIQLNAGKFDSALRLAEQVLENDPAFFYDVDPVANVYCAEGRWQVALKRYESLSVDLLVKPNFQLAICCAHTGQTDRALQILHDLEALSERRYVDRVHLAAIYASLGQKDKAFAALDRACDDRSARVSTPRFYSWLSPLFDDPRFTALEDKVTHSALSESTDQHH